MRMVKKALIIASAISIIIIPTLQCNATELINSDNEMYSGYVDDPYERLGVDTNNNLLSVPSSFDPRELNYTTANKIQETSNLCWLYATTGMAETFVSKNYGSKFNISPSHGAVAMSNAILPTDSSIGYYTNRPDCGGNNCKAFQYLTNWNSPIFNNLDTVGWNSIVSENSYPLSDFLNIDSPYLNLEFSDSKSLFNITSMTYLNSHDIDGIKMAIKEYGGVSTGISTVGKFNTDDDGEINFYSARTYPSPNHAVILVGWDDNYSKNNFSQDLDDKVTCDGAWLVKNSYDDKKYFWLSYQDGFLNNLTNNVAVITGVKKANSNEKMLSYDYFPIAFNSNCYYKDDIYFCNVYDVSKYTDAYDQIDNVMFYLRSTDCKYELKIVPVHNNTIPDDVDNYQTVSTGTFKGEGYLTAQLNKPYLIGSADKYAFILKLSPLTSTNRIYIPYEGSYSHVTNQGTFVNYPEINDNESYLGTVDNGVINWKDCNIDTSYCDNSVKGNLIIRPVLSKEDSSLSSTITLEPNVLTSVDNDVDINITGDLTLFSIHTSENRILREGIDYNRTANGVTIKASYLKTLDNNYTEIVFEFNNNVTKILTVNPKSDITKVEVVGKPIVGEKLTVDINGIPEKDQYNVSYQWQSSVNGTSWVNISDANKSDYIVNENDFRRYIRVLVKARKNGNVIYPSEKYSPSTDNKVVILGDVNLDGTITIEDATLLNKYIAKVSTLSSDQLLAADVDGNGIINIIDSSLIQKLAYTKE